MEKTRLKWTLEDYPRKFPFDLNHVEGIEDEIHRYVSLIEDQLKLRSFIDDALLAHGGTQILIEVVESTVNSAFHGIHWEMLEQWLDITSSRTPRVPIMLTRVVLSNRERSARDDRPSNTKSRPLPSRTYNILLVVSREKDSRKKEKHDIDPLLGAKALNDVILKLFPGLADGLPNLEIVRPGSWKAFERYIHERTEQWHRAGGIGNWFDVVHFDLHGRLLNDSPYLQFLSASGRKLLISADQVGQVLVQHLVPFVVLHACELAKATTQNTNLAEILINDGVERIIAMSYELTATAAQIFMRTFYYHLLWDTTKNPVIALHAARLALFENAERLGKLDQTVVLPDYFVPVMYTSSIAPQEHTDSGTLELAPRLYEAAQHFGTSYANPRLTYSVLGREQDVLEIEWLLLREGHPNIGLITGPVGIGKTTLVQFLGNWWI